MKSSRLFVIAIVSGLLALNSAFGASKKKAPPPAAGPVITSVSATSITVTEGKASKTLAINQFTEITVNGQKATAAELKAGMGATITLGTDPTKASRIVAMGR